MLKTTPTPPRSYGSTHVTGLPKVKAWRCQIPTCRHVWKDERPQVECPECHQDDVCIAPMSMQPVAS